MQRKCRSQESALWFETREQGRMPGLVEVRMRSSRVGKLLSGKEVRQWIEAGPRGESMLTLGGSGALHCVVRGMVLVQRKQYLLGVCMHEGALSKAMCLMTSPSQRRRV